MQLRAWLCNTQPGGRRCARVPPTTRTLPPGAGVSPQFRRCEIMLRYVAVGVAAYPPAVRLAVPRRGLPLRHHWLNRRDPCRLAGFRHQSSGCVPSAARVRGLGKCVRPAPTVPPARLPLPVFLQPVRGGARLLSAGSRGADQAVGAFIPIGLTGRHGRQAGQRARPAQRWHRPSFRASGAVRPLGPLRAARKVGRRQAERSRQPPSYSLRVSPGRARVFRASGHH